jgi:chemotaxis family two-component system sensor kinase Cph1
VTKATKVNLEEVSGRRACDDEPIHIPGSIEPSGVLLVLEQGEFSVIQASDNVGPWLGRDTGSLLGAPLDQIFEPQSDAAVRHLLRHSTGTRRQYLSGVRLRNVFEVFDATVHRHDGVFLVELEPASADDNANAPELYSSLTEALAELEGTLTLLELCDRVAAHVRRITGFDRVMVYRFLEDDSGSVIAENRREDLPPYLGLRYPASDIPAQARRLYLLNTLRLKADVNAERVPLVPAINPITRKPLDMSHCVLRAMSPVHDEYLRNMGVSASMSVSIVKDEHLWGLIACHHIRPKIVDYKTRISCEVLARVFSNHIAASEEEDLSSHAKLLREVLGDLERRLQGEAQVRATLGEEGERIASEIGAYGFAICLAGEAPLTIGGAPGIQEVERLVDWLKVNQDQPVFATDKISEQWPESANFSEAGRGILAARITKLGSDFLLWFRPPALKVVEWAGNPSKPVEETDNGQRISPRTSFERWKQTVGDRSEPWQAHERNFALTLRQIVAEALLVKKNEEAARLNFELERSNIELDAFAYAASHDLQEPVRTIRSFAQLLSRRAATRLNTDERQLLEIIESGAARMSNLIAALLAYGQVGGSAKLERQEVNLEDVLRWVLVNLDEAVRFTSATVTHDALPRVVAVPEQMTQLLQNLIGNSLKYRKEKDAPCVHVSIERQGASIKFGVHDNGQGFDPEDSEKIFRVFKRLHGKEVPGSGLGLALCKRIVENHGGKIWAEGKGSGQGATIWFTLPAA